MIGSPVEQPSPPRDYPYSAKILEFPFPTKTSFLKKSRNSSSSGRIGSTRKTPSPVTAAIDAQHAHSLTKLRNTFSKIFERYDKPFYEFETDIVDLTTLTIIKNKGFLATLPDRHVPFVGEIGQDLREDTREELRQNSMGQNLLPVEDSSMTSDFQPPDPFALNSNGEDYYKELYDVNVQDCRLDMTLGHQSGGESLASEMDDIENLNEAKQPRKKYPRKSKAVQKVEKTFVKMAEKKSSGNKRLFSEYPKPHAKSIFSKECETFVTAAFYNESVCLSDYLHLKEKILFPPLKEAIEDVLKSDYQLPKFHEYILKNDSYSLDSGEYTFPTDARYTDTFIFGNHVDSQRLTDLEKTFLASMEEHIDSLISYNENIKKKVSSAPSLKSTDIMVIIEQCKIMNE